MANDAAAWVIVGSGDGVDDNVDEVRWPSSMPLVLDLNICFILLVNAAVVVVLVVPPPPVPLAIPPVSARASSNGQLMTLVLLISFLCPPALLVEALPAWLSIALPLFTLLLVGADTAEDEDIRSSPLMTTFALLPSSLVSPAVFIPLDFIATVVLISTYDMYWNKPRRRRYGRCGPLGA